MVKVATVVKKIPSQAFIYSPTTTFDYIADAFMSALSRSMAATVIMPRLFVLNFKTGQNALQNNDQRGMIGCL